MSVSVFTLTALSFDRYNVIVNPVQSYVAGPKSKRRIIFTLAVIWLVSLGLASPAAVFSRLVQVKLLQTSNSSTVVVYDVNDDALNQTQNDNETSAQLLVRFCYPFPGKFGVDIHSKSVIVGRVLIQYLIPLAIIGTFYTITARNLLRKYKSFLIDFVYLLSNQPHKDMHTVFYIFYNISTGNIDGQATVTAASTRPNHPPSTNSPTNNVRNFEQKKNTTRSVKLKPFISLYFHFPQTNSNQESRRKVARMVQVEFKRWRLNNPLLIRT